MPPRSCGRFRPIGPFCFFPISSWPRWWRGKRSEATSSPIPGYCHVHKTIRPEQVVELLEEHPDIELLLHPECGCVSSCMAKAVDGTLPQDRTFFLSTEGMLRHIGESSARRVRGGNGAGHLAPAEQGTFRKRTFYPVNPNAVCAFMKTITLDKVIQSLETMSPQVRVPEEIARKARRAIDRMLELA